ncbi:hypothetical protein FEM48_Zijuj05G0096500 [Ziziphus jujuba var. spinosa]|uniref:Retrotransposon gag domain-containing protein n=1 Tax=Ziziphus jujuba var. spinosa TaxID=714518 RepID=A0A978VE79_ZIZJJ|nr:hypothetical protein FEM48_Zijuj05G0096500 [Ziziphus jujuba var. spinosa]
MQQVLIELQALCLARNPQPVHQEINPFSTEESSNNHNEVHNPHLKLPFLKFDGEDLSGWIYKAEQYFEYQRVLVEQKVQITSFHLEGIVLQWHHWLTKFRGPLTCPELIKAVLIHFGPTNFDDPSETLTRLKQTTIVAAYQEAFERLSQRVDRVLENFLIGCFIARLRDDIQLDVKIKHPTTLAETIGVARLIEERN